MSTLELFKKISFREGFFLSMAIVIIACYIFRFMQVTTLETWCHSGIIAAICFLVLCLMFDFGKLSKERNERMQIFAGLSLTLLLFVSCGMSYYLYIADNLVSGRIFCAMLIASFVVYMFLLYLECIAFFQYQESETKETDGLRHYGTDTHNGNSITYSGLGKEPYWNEYLSIRNDYTEPCYVYADKFESVTFVNGHGRVIGYRISPTLVIHSMVSQDNNGNADLQSELRYFINEYGGEMLEEKDIPVLRKNWDTVDSMRKKIGDTPLPVYIIPYIMPDHNVYTTHIFDGRVFTNPKFGSIVLKRCMKKQ